MWLGWPACTRRMLELISLFNDMLDAHLQNKALEHIPPKTRTRMHWELYKMLEHRRQVRRKHEKSSA